MSAVMVKPNVAMIGINAEIEMYNLNVSEKKHE